MIATKIKAGRLSAAALLATAGVAALLAAAAIPVLPERLLTGTRWNGLVFTISNQLLHPWGRQALILGRPVEIAIDASGARVAVLNTNWYSSIPKVHEG